MRWIGLVLCLFVFWLALSGHYTAFLMSAGAGCAVLCALATHRAGALDAEGAPLELLPRGLLYFPWLIKEIAKSAWSVTKVIIDPRLPVTPTMTVVKASQRSAAGIATYANSITLTPGTITVGVNGNELTVHAVVREGALDLEAGDMDRRVAAIEGPR